MHIKKKYIVSYNEHTAWSALIKEKCSIYLETLHKLKKCEQSTIFFLSKLKFFQGNTMSKFIFTFPQNSDISNEISNQYKPFLQEICKRTTLI